MRRSLKMKNVLLPTLATLCVLAFAHAEDAKPKTDLERLQGSWYMTRIEENGAALAGTPSHKLVFTGKMMTLGVIPDTYKLNEKSDPKQLDYGFCPGIYKLEGDKLIYCMSTYGAVDAPRPTKFATAPGESVQLFEFKRSPRVPADAPEKDFDKPLKLKIREGVKLLEAKRDADFLKGFMQPEEFKQLDEKRIKEIVDRFDSHRPGMLNTFRTLLKLQPTIRKSKIGTIAEFDLTRIEIADGPPAKVIAFLKVSDSWYLVNDQEGVKE